MQGSISFNSGFRYIQDVQVFQYRIGELVLTIITLTVNFLWQLTVEENNQLLAMTPIGLLPILVPVVNLSFFTNESIATLWPDGVPRDGTPREVTNYSLIPLTAVCYIYATVGIFFALTCLIFNIVFRNKK